MGIEGEGQKQTNKKCDISVKNAAAYTIQFLAREVFSDWMGCLFDKELRSL